jgi:hypothetical protein
MKNEDGKKERRPQKMEDDLNKMEDELNKWKMTSKIIEDDQNKRKMTNINGYRPHWKRIPHKRKKLNLDFCF